MALFSDDVRARTRDTAQTLLRNYDRSFLGLSMRRIVASHLRKVNSSSNFVRMPSAVLVCIVDHLRADNESSLQSIMRLSFVCRDLREAMLATPQLWAEVFPEPWTYYRQSDLVMMLIARSAPAPLRLRLFLELTVWSVGDRFSKLADAISSNMHRMVLLEVQMTCFNVSITTEGLDQTILWPTDLWMTFCHALTQPAPALKRIQFLVNVQGSSPSLPSGVFAGYAPTLKHCTIRQLFLISTPYSAFSNLVSLRYDPFGSSLHEAAIRHILQNLPNLDLLDLEGSWSAPCAEAPLLPLADTRLRKVRLTGHEHPLESIYRLFTHTASVEQIIYRCPYRRINAQSVYAVLPSRAVFTEAHFGFDFVVFVVCIQRDCGPDSDNDSISRMRRLRLIHTSCVIGDSPQRLEWYSKLTSVTLHELHWPEDVCLPDAPHVTALRIFMASCSDHSYALLGYGAPGESYGLGIFHTTSEGRWNCPRLETVRLTYALASSPRTCATAYSDLTCYCREVLSISLAELFDFVEKSLPRVHLLTVEGCDPIDSDLGVQLARLQTLAEHVELLSVGSPSIMGRSLDWEEDLSELFDLPL